MKSKYELLEQQKDTIHSIRDGVMRRLKMIDTSTLSDSDAISLAIAIELQDMNESIGDIGILNDHLLEISDSLTSIASRFEKLSSPGSKMVYSMDDDDESEPSVSYPHGDPNWQYTEDDD